MLRRAGVSAGGECEIVPLPGEVVFQMGQLARQAILKLIGRPIPELEQQASCRGYGAVQRGENRAGYRRGTPPAVSGKPSGVVAASDGAYERRSSPELAFASALASSISSPVGRRYNTRVAASYEAALAGGAITSSGPSTPMLDACASSPIYLSWRFAVWKWTLCDTQTAVCPLPPESANRLPRSPALGSGGRRSRTPCPYDAYRDGVCSLK